MGTSDTDGHGDSVVIYPFFVATRCAVISAMVHCARCIRRSDGEREDAGTIKGVTRTEPRDLLKYRFPISINVLQTIIALMAVAMMPVMMMALMMVNCMLAAHWRWRRIFWPWRWVARC